MSLGFPDGLLGSGWPAIKTTFGFDTEVVGVLTTVIFIFSFFSSILYTKIVSRFSLAMVFQGSTLIVIAGLTFFALINNLFGIILASICLGLGAGCIDVGINDYVSFYYNEKIMAWVHGFWGIGITVGSGVMTFVLTIGLNWSYSYLIIAFFEVIVLMLLSFKKKNIKAMPQHSTKGCETHAKLTKSNYLGPIYYFCYGIEYIVGLYFSTFLLEVCSLNVGQAAFQVSIYWAFLMLGRFTSGFLSSLFSIKKIVYAHLLISAIGAVLLFSKKEEGLYVASIFLGYGFSALYPMMMRFPYDIYDSTIASKVVSYQVGFQFLGVMILPIIYGVLFKHVSFVLFPMSILISLAIMTLIIWKLTYKRR